MAYKPSRTPKYWKDELMKRCNWAVEGPSEAQMESVIEEAMADEREASASFIENHPKLYGDALQMIANAIRTRK